MHSSAAKLFDLGGSQAVRLRAEFCFNGTDEAYFRRDERTCDVIVSTRSLTDWRAFMALRGRFGPLPNEFPGDRAQGGQGRGPFEGYAE